MKIYDIGCFGIVVKVNDEGAGTIESDLHEDLDPLDQGSMARDFAMHALEGLILAHACAGIDIAAPAYIEGIETAVESCENQFG